MACRRLWSLPKVTPLPRGWCSQSQRHVSVLSNNRVVTADGTELHPLWLRERCHGPASVQWETLQPLHQPNDFPMDLGIRSARIRTKSGKHSAKLKVEFTDGHISTFDTVDLEQEVKDFHNFGVQQPDIQLPKVNLWDGSASVPRISYADVAAKGEGILEFTTKLLREGHVVVEGVPAEDKQIMEFAKLVSGFAGESVVRPTNWGEVFNVRNVPDGNMKDLAYTAEALPPHVDNPYRDPNPGFQLLHCLENECSTGQSIAVDGLSVVEKLRTESPEYVDILSQVECRWENDGGDRSTALVLFAPMLSVNNAGKVVQIRYSPKSGGYCPALGDMEKLSLFFAARRRFAELLNDEANIVNFRLNKGDLWVFNNLRVLHGRSSFNPQEGMRHFQGAYVDMDAVHTAFFRAKYKMKSDQTA